MPRGLTQGLWTCALLAVCGGNVPVFVEKSTSETVDSTTSSAPVTTGMQSDGGSTELQPTGASSSSSADSSTITPTDPCPPGKPECMPCLPGQYRCVGLVVQGCVEESWLDLETCDPLLGLTCAPEGFCTGECSGLGDSHIGCDYFPVTTAQDSTAFVDNTFAVAVVNAGKSAASVNVTYDGDTIAEGVVPVGSALVIPLPRISALTDAIDTNLVKGGSYRLRSTAPVTVYQYNTLKKSSSNDASVLFPSNSWTGDYIVASWHHWDSFNSPGLVAVTASQDDTLVTITPPQGGTPTDPGVGIEGDGYGDVVLDRGDVLQLFSRHFGDFTGMHVTADKPIQVLGGHQCTAVPSESFACDHLEEAMIPFEALGRNYAVVPPVQWPDTEQAKAVFVRVIAAEAATTLSFEPDQQATKYLLNVGDFAELGPVTEAFTVSSDKKIVVAQYMVSQEYGYGWSDPAMVLAIPREQQRANYVLYAHPSWLASYVDITSDMDSEVLVDGVAVKTFMKVGNSDVAFAHVPLSNAGDGVHRIVAKSPIGVSVYGVGDYGSYWYPGGLNVAIIPQ